MSLLGFNMCNDIHPIYNHKYRVLLNLQFLAYIKNYKQEWTNDYEGYRIKDKSIANMHV